MDSYSYLLIDIRVCKMTCEDWVLNTKSKWLFVLDITSNVIKLYQIVCDSLHNFIVCHTVITYCYDTYYQWLFLSSFVSLDGCRTQNYFITITSVDTILNKFHLKHENKTHYSLLIFAFWILNFDQILSLHTTLCTLHKSSLLVILQVGNMHLIIE